MTHRRGPTSASIRLLANGAKPSLVAAPRIVYHPVRAQSRRVRAAP